MPNSIRRLTPEPLDEERDVARNPNLPENDVGAVAVAQGGARQRDENSLSFRHFLQQHSDVVPQPAPTRARSARGPHAGTVDLVDVTMALPDFVQDHLVMESLANTGDHSNEVPSRQLQHAGPSLDLNILNEILPDYGPSQRHPVRVSHGPSRRRSGQEVHPSSNGDNPHSHGSVALPDFLSDGPMQLNHNDSSINNSPAISAANRTSRARGSLENEPVRGPSFESKESLRLEINRLRRELTEKNRRLNQLEMELARSSGTSETSMRAAERNVTDANKRAAEAEKHVMVLNKELSRLKVENGHGEGSSATASSSSSGVSVSNGLEPSRNFDPGAVLNVARTSEVLVSQLMHQIEELKRMAVKAEAQSQGEKSKGKDTSKKSQQ